MLYGDGLHLRRLLREDIEKINEIYKDEYVMKYNGGQFIAKELVIESLKMVDLSDKATLVIVSKRGHIVGITKYRESDYGRDVYNISITIAREYWRQKYGQKTIDLLLRYLFKRKRAHKVELEVVKENIAAINCYKKCGFVEEGLRREKYFYDGQYLDTILMGILKEEYIK